MPKNQQTGAGKIKSGDSDYLWSMSYAPKADESAGLAQMLPLIVFTAIIIFITRGFDYNMPVDQFFWASGNVYTDFFSYGKMIAILVCGTLAFLMLLFRAFTQSLAIKRTVLYIPMAVYTFFVIASYAFSEYKEFALIGAMDRFEGTLVLLSYILLLFFAVNTINTERNVKFIVYPLAVASALLSLLGISQATGHDFFRTSVGKMMITPPTYWDRLDELIFNFKDGEIYQTVYNINYVSFYLTLLLPVFGLLFIRSVMKRKEEKPVFMIIWGLLFVLCLYNLIGSQSSGGFLGMGAVVFAALLLLNKRILTWWKPVALLLVMTLVIGVMTFDRWQPELRQAVVGTVASGTTNVTEEERSEKSYIDYMEVTSNIFNIKLSVNGNPLTISLQPEDDFLPTVYDGDSVILDFAVFNEEDGQYYIDDDRFNMCVVNGYTDERGYKFFVLTTDKQEWYFLIASDGLFYINPIGKLAEFKRPATMGFENNQDFGSGRGFIWSRTFPMMIDTIFIGNGADTFNIYFPQNDYVGKYNAGWKLGMITDKPHNMYMGMAVGTGGVSLLAFLTLLALYFIQSVRIYRRRDYSGFTEYAGLGIFLGILGFAAAGLVNDSNVSVMPMFYGLLGTGIAINMMLKRIPTTE